MQNEKSPEKLPNPAHDYYFLKKSILSVLTAYFNEVASTDYFDPDVLEMNLSVMFMAEQRLGTGWDKILNNIEEAKSQLREFIQKNDKLQEVLRNWEHNEDTVCAIIDTVAKRYYSQ